MAEFHPGDLVTFHLRDNLYGVARILLIENLALNDNVHLAVYDRVVEGTEGGHDIYGDPDNRQHEFDGEIATTVLISHLAMTWEAFLASIPLKVGQAEIEESELAGYQIWLHNRYQKAVEQGMLREREDEEEEFDEEEDLDASESDIESESVERSEDEDADADPAESAGSDAAAEMQGEEQKKAWVILSIEDVPVGQWLFQQHDNMRDAPLLASSELGRYILSHYDDSNIEQIEELVRNFVDGDYGAGHELLEFGDTAANALARELDNTDSPELADDILRILADMGNDRAYEHIALYLGAHSNLAADPLALPAARAYLYSVMLTGGDPAPLRAHLSMVEELKHPELVDDRKNAIEAIRAGEKY